MAKFTGYLSIFEEKLGRLRKDIKKAESAGKKVPKNLRDEVKSLEEMLEDMREHNMVQVECPCCGEKFKVDSEKVKLKTS